MRVCITGASGLLGSTIQMLAPSSWDITGITHHFGMRPHRDGIRILSADLLRQSLSDILGANEPDAIIHCAALTNVDRCEKEDRAVAFGLHVRVTEGIARYARERGIHLVHISTDHIFDGAQGNYSETDTPRPINYYAETKLLAEDALRAHGGDWTIVRTNFFGIPLQEKTELASWIVRSLREQKTIELFTDVIFSPLLVNTLAEYIIRMVEEHVIGLFHVAGHDSCSKYDFGVKIAQALGMNSDTLLPKLADSTKMGALRPKNMSLNPTVAEAALHTVFPTVQQSVALYIALLNSSYLSQLRSLAIV